MATRNYHGKKIELTSVNDTVDSLTIEEALQISINGKPFTVTMRTPGEDINLVRGLLHTEGVVSNSSYNPKIIPKKGEGIVTKVDLTIPEKELGEGYSNSRSLLSVSSCGICVRTELEDVKSNNEIISIENSINAGFVGRMFEQMNQYQKAFHQSGGTHAAAAFDKKGNLLCSLEDIGRHNAVDKIIGKLIIENKLSNAVYMTVSGRISYEIIIKCFKAKIPVIAAVSAPSSLSVDYAKELGITLLAFCREGRATCYSHSKRLKKEFSVS